MEKTQQTSNASITQQLQYIVILQ